MEERKEGRKKERKKHTDRLTRTDNTDVQTEQVAHRKEILRRIMKTNANKIQRGIHK
jgi:hypothetical protein